MTRVSGKSYAWRYGDKSLYYPILVWNEQLGYHDIVEIQGYELLESERQDIQSGCN